MLRTDGDLENLFARDCESDSLRVGFDIESSLSERTTSWPEQRWKKVIPLGFVQGEPVPVPIRVLDQGLRTGIGKEQARMPPVIKEKHRHRINGVGRRDDRSGATSESGGSDDHGGRCVMSSQIHRLVAVETPAPWSETVRCRQIRSGRF